MTVVAVGVLLDQGVDLRVADGVDHGDQVVDAVGVHRHAPPQLGLDLVALGDRDVAHVVAEAGQPHRRERGPSEGGARPGPDTDRDARVVDVAGDRQAVEAEPGCHEAELTVAVRGLVQVHEVHVDLGPRERLVDLRVQVQHRLAQCVETGDPHLGRAERVHPRDHADARVVRAGLDHHPADRGGVGQHRLRHDAHRELRARVERARHAGRLLRHLAQHVVAVQALAPGEEPDLLHGGAEGAHVVLLSWP